MFLTSTCPIYNLGFVLLQLCEQCASLQSKVHILYCQHFYNNSFNYRQVSWRLEAPASVVDDHEDVFGGT